MMNTTRRGFLKVFSILGTVLGLSSAAKAKTTNRPSFWDACGESAEDLGIEGLPVIPAIDWEKDNQYVHDLAHGKIRWEDGSVLTDAKGNEVSKESIPGGCDYHSYKEFKEQLPPDHHEQWLSHGERLTVDRIKLSGLTPREWVERASAWAKPAPKS